MRDASSNRGIADYARQLQLAQGCNNNCSINKKKLVFLIPPRFSGLPLALGDLVDSRWVLEKIKQSFKLLSKISLHLKPLCRQSSLKLKGYFFNKLWVAHSDERSQNRDVIS